MTRSIILFIWETIKHSSRYFNRYADISKSNLKSLPAPCFINPLLGVNISEYLIHYISGKPSDNVHPTILMYRPIRLTQCCTQFKSTGVRFFVYCICVIMLHSQLNDIEISETKRFIPKAFELGTTLTQPNRSISSFDFPLYRVI